MNEYILTPSDSCGCNDKYVRDPYFKIENHLKELNTELAKAEARFNLGIPDEWNLKWGNITGFIELQTDLYDYLNSFLNSNKELLNILFEELTNLLTLLIEEQSNKVENSRQELDLLILNFESFRKEFTDHVNLILDTKLDKTQFDELVNTTLPDQLNAKVDKTDIENIENPINHKYYTLEDTSITNVKQALDKLLYKNLLINSFTVSPSEAEIGETITNATYTWSYNKFITSLLFNGINIDLNDRSKSITNITSTISRTLSATDGTMDVSKTVSITFKNGKYYGTAITNPTNSDIISKFTRNLNLAQGGSFTVNAKAGEYIYLLVPESMSDIKFNVGGFEGGFSIVNNNFLFIKNGVTTKCVLFKSDNHSLGTTTVTIK